VVLESINILTGPTSTQPEIPVGTKAAVDAINAAGGIQGRPLKVINCDDGAGQNADASCAREAVSSQALAVVGANTAFGDTYVPIIAAAGIPTVGDEANSAAEATSKDAFPLGGGSSVSITGWGSLLGHLGCQHIKLLNADIAATQYLGSNYFDKAGLQAGGAKLQQQVLVPTTATDLTPYISTFASGSDCGADITSGDQAKVVLNDLYQAGWKGKFVYGLNEFSQKDVTQLGPAADNLYLDGNYAPVNDNSIPGIAQFNREIKATGSSVAPDENMLQVWLAIHLVAQMAQNVHPLTAAGLVNALKTGGQISFKGVMHPVDYSKPSPFAPNTYTTYATFDKVVNGKITPIFGGQFVNVLDPSSWPSS
jgi:ABC-type branched-subunit amino acid transport system substrate-binding protein